MASTWASSAMNGPFDLSHALQRRQSAGQSGSAQQDQSNSNSLSSFLSTLIPAAIAAVVMVVLFLILRRSQRRWYAPRTYLGSLREEKRSPDLPSGLTNWFSAFFRIPDTYVLNHSSIDAYLFLRYLQIATVICLVGCIVTWPVLLPVNATGGAGKQQLDMLTMGNILNHNRYYAHMGVSYIFFGFVIFMVTRESIFFISLRQAYLLSPLYSQRMSSRTVLFTSVPLKYLDEIILRRTLGPQVKNFWVATNCKKLQKLVDERESAALRLEGAEVNLVKLCNKARVKSQKKGGNAHDSETEITADGATVESGSAASRWIKQKDRPTHRTKFLIGKKVDSIDWARSELQRLIPEIDQAQDEERAGKGQPVGSVFVEFTDQTSAQDSFQALTHHQPLHMSPRYIGVLPEEVIWNNLRIKWWERIVRTIGTTALSIALIIFFAIPVAVVGAISNINFLIDKLPWLSFIEKLPSVVLGVITGLLPSILLAVLLALVPIFFRLMSRLSGAPSLSAIELSTQNSYFAFQIIQGFLVITIASGATSVVTSIINNPSSALSLLANNLPKASNFYISYFCLQGLAISSKALVQITGLIIFKVLTKLLDKTPRKLYTRWTTLAGLSWGSLFPPFTALLCISLVYSIIAPIVLGFATIMMFLIYLAYRYNLLFVYNANIDTKGLIYTRALQQTMVGVYIGEVLLIALFAIGVSIGPLVLEIVLLIITVLFHVSLNSSLEPTLKYLPKSLQAEEDALLAAEQDETVHNGDAKEAILGANTPNKKPNFFTKWLHPDIYADYYTIRKSVPTDITKISYSPETERDAYFHPAITTSTPMLWIPRDQMGVSRQECLHSGQVIPISDEGASLDDKNKIVWDWQERPPIYEEAVYY